MIEGSSRTTTSLRRRAAMGSCSNVVCRVGGRAAEDV